MEILSREIGLSNVHVIKDEKTIIVDTGTYRNKAGMLNELRAMGVDPKEVSLIILTHGHMDHCANVNVLKELTGAPVLAHKNAVKFLETGEFDPYVPRGEWGKMFFDFVKDNPVDLPDPITPDIIVGDEDFDLSAYGVHGKVIYTPGHVNSNITVLLDSGEAICGDTIIINPFNGFNGTGALFCDDREALDRSLERLFKEAHTYYSGHGGPFTKDQIQVDPE